MIFRPGLQAVGVDGSEAFFPKAIMPPVKVTLGETITFAGSDCAEIMTAWILDGVPPGAVVTGGWEGDKPTPLEFTTAALVDTLLTCPST